MVAGLVGVGGFPFTADIWDGRMMPGLDWQLGLAGLVCFGKEAC